MLNAECRMVKPQPFPYLLLPALWSSRNRVRRRLRGDGLRAALFASVAVVVGLTLFAGAFWLTFQLQRFAEFGDYLLRLGLSWVFLAFLSFLAFSGVVTALSTFFLSRDLQLLLAAPIAPRRLFQARFARTVAQAAWMVVVFLVPVLAGIGVAACAGPAFYATAVIVIPPFTVIPVAAGTAVTLLLVNVVPARRARDILMLMGLVFAASLIVLLRVVRPEQLLSVESLPDVADFFATLQSPVTPLLPSFWAGEALFAGFKGSVDVAHGAALWTTAAAFTLLLRLANERWYFAGFSRSQEARKARFTRLRLLDRILARLPLTAVRRQLLTKDLKIFLRDVSQWSQLLLLLALALVYLYNFRVLDLDRVPYMSGPIRNVYAFVNLCMAAFVMATIAVRFVFPAVSAEGPAFWVIRTAPVRLRDFLWSKFWMGLLPIVVLTEALIVTANEFLGIDPVLKVVTPVAIALMGFALVGLATSLGARYPRFAAENPTEIAGSYGGVAFMVLAVLLIVVTIALIGWPCSILLFSRRHGLPLSGVQQLIIAGSFAAAVLLSMATWLVSMRMGVEALDGMGSA